jgi:hypothetical protein
MRVETNDKGEIVLKEVYSGVLLQTSYIGENFGICMRDGGFEFNYGGQWYQAKGGVVSEMTAAKASHTPATDTPVKVEPEKIEVLVRNAFDTSGDLVWSGHLYSNTIIPEDKFPAIKKAIEEVLNPPASTPAPEDKGWQIVEFASSDVRLIKHKDGAFGTYGATESELINSSGHTIWAVKRMSDGEVFSVGERVIRNGYEDKVYQFQIDGNNMKVAFHGGDVIGLFDLQTIQKLPPKPLPLFTTNGGIDIFPGQPYWHITSDWTPQMEIATEARREQYKNREMVTFVTESAANEYIFFNNPHFSLHEIWGVFSNFIKAGDRVIAFREMSNLAQSKQSK